MPSLGPRQRAMESSSLHFPIVPTRGRSKRWWEGGGRPGGSWPVPHRISPLQHTTSIHIQGEPLLVVTHSSLQRRTNSSTGTMVHTLPSTTGTRPRYTPTGAHTQLHMQGNTLTEAFSQWSPTHHFIYSLPLGVGEERTPPRTSHPGPTRLEGGADRRAVPSLCPVPSWPDG